MRARSEEILHQLATALRDRAEEIEQTIGRRALMIGSLDNEADLEYREGLRLAIKAAVDHTISAIEDDGERFVAVPVALLSQARLAARRDVALETMLRRYLAGHAMLGDIMVEEAERRGLPGDLLRSALRAQAARTDRVLAAIATCYVEELSGIGPPESTEQRRLQQVRRLLAGDLIDSSGLGYEMAGWHVGLAARMPEGGRAIQGLARRLDLRALVVPVEDDLFWAWLGAPEKSRLGPVEKVLRASLGDTSRAGIGEPTEGRPGWRLTHEQARASLSVAERTGETIARYGEVALLASAMQDEVFTASLRTLYLAPLEDGRSDGRSLSDTLRVYLATDQSVTSTAATMGVNRNTVAKRLRHIEDRIGLLRGTRVANVIIALNLGE